jgi:dienelactone hydrolase
MRRGLLALLTVGCVLSAARADVQTRPAEYRHGAVVLNGFLTHDPAAKGKRPGVLILHADAGQAPAVRQRAEQWAKVGHVCFAADLSGKSASTAKLALSPKDRTALRERAAAALEALRKSPQVDPDKVAAVGYGLGGTAALELARGGADLEGVVCVHGDLSTPTPGDAKKVAARLLVLLGTDDPKVPLDQLAAFEDEMRAGGVDWQVIRYGGAAHDFTNPAAGRDLAGGRAYDATADRRATDAVRGFLTELFAPSPAPARAEKPAKEPSALPPGVLAKVAKVLQHADDTGRALEGYEGGRTFLNLERRLPQQDAQRRRIKYREWDVNPLRPGVNRGAERLVTGSDGSAYYTDDHYRSFKKIR